MLDYFEQNNTFLPCCKRTTSLFALLGLEQSIIRCENGKIKIQKLHHLATFSVHPFGEQLTNKHNLSTGLGDILSLKIIFPFSSSCSEYCCLMSSEHCQFLVYRNSNDIFTTTTTKDFDSIFRGKLEPSLCQQLKFSAKSPEVTSSNDELVSLVRFIYGVCFLHFLLLLPLLLLTPIEQMRADKLSLA